MISTAAATARVLADAGITRVFGLPGGEVLVLMDELRRAGIDFVLMRHESNAGIAAAVYGKLRGQPGVVLTTLGPGAANLMLPLCSSYLDQEPLLAISAQIPDDFPASHTHQLLPLHDVYRPIARYVDKITSGNVFDVVPRALEKCMERPFGASYLTLSAREALKPSVGFGVQGSGVQRSVKGSGFTVQGSVTDVRAQAHALAAALGRAKRPLVVIGLSIDPANAARMRRWVSEWNLPVAVTPKVKGIVDETAANFVGVVGGMAAEGVMCDAIAAADLVVGLGLDPVEVDKTWHADRPIHWVLESPNAGGVVPAGVVLVDHAAILDALVEQPPPATWPSPFKAFQDKRARMLNDRAGSAGTMWPGDIVQALASVMPAETIVTTDVGSHKYLFGQYWPSRQPETFWMSNGLSGMSYGLSAAIGAKLARPDAPVLAAVGDGGFSMNAQELESAERVAAPFITVVLEDGSYSLIKISQAGKKLEPYRTDFRPIDTMKMAEACGVAGLRTSNPDELAAAAKQAVDRRRSLVIAVPVNDADYPRMF
ncbi:MAG TPA: thiamine pyrophosphate-binding protein [Vicinamibacterales bacterium]|nr:thiamine pyrophosphate-binding protein [Vicinamibacterales bacterium]